MIQKEKYITIATKDGLVKKTEAKEYESTISSIIAINLNEGDKVIGASFTDGNDHVLLGTKKGYTIHFSEEQISPTGRNTKGSKGINLKAGDEVISFNISDNSDLVIALTKNGRGKATPLEEYTLQNRYGKGLKTLSNDKYTLLSLFNGKDDEEIMLVSGNGILNRIKINDITSTKRLGSMYSQVKLDNDQIIKVFKLPKLDQDDI